MPKAINKTFISTNKKNEDIYLETTKAYIDFARARSRLFKYELSESLFLLVKVGILRKCNKKLN